MNEELKRLIQFVACVSAAVVCMMLIAGCDREKPTVQECVTQKVNELRKGQVTVGWAGACKDMKPDQREQVDQQVADQL